MGTLSGEATLPFSVFLPPSTWGLTHNRKEFAPMEQILTCLSRPHFRMSKLPKEADMKSQKLFPFVKLAEKYGGVLVLLNYPIREFQSPN